MVSGEHSVFPGQIAFYDKDGSSRLFQNIDGLPLCKKVAVFDLSNTSFFTSSSFLIKIFGLRKERKRALALQSLPPQNITSALKPLATQLPHVL